MNEAKLKVMLEKHFPTRPEFGDFKTKMYEFKIEMYDFKKDMYQFRKDMNYKLDSMEDKIDDLINSSRALDRLFEQHPVERIHRLEKRVGLQPFIPRLSEDSF